MLNRKSPPPFIQSASYDLLKPEVYSFSDQRKIFFIHGGEQDVVKIEFVFRAGKWMEPHPGVSYFTATLLPKGTPSHDSFEITNTLDFYGIHPEISPGFDFTSISFYGLSGNFPPVMDLIVDILSRATFPENELQQAKDIYLQELKINLEKTSYLASRQFRKNIFGENHPYGGNAEDEEVRNILQKQLASFRDHFYSDLTVFVSGKLTGKTKALIIDKLAPMKYASVNSIDHRKSTSAPKEQHLPKEGSVQASLRIGKTTIGRSHPDYAGLLLLNHLLGGYFGSRLMKNIREEKGLTYGIHSTLHAFKHESYWVIGTDVNRENREEAIAEIKHELEKLRQQPVSKHELDTARNHFIGSLQSELSTPFAHADKIKMVRLFDLPDDHYEQLIRSFNLFTFAQLMQLAENYFVDDDLYIVSVG